MRAYLISATVAAALATVTPRTADAQVVIYPTINTSPYVSPVAYTYPVNYSYGYTYPAYPTYSYGYTYPTWNWGYQRPYPYYTNYWASPRYGWGVGYRWGGRRW